MSSLPRTARTPLKLLAAAAGMVLMGLAATAHAYGSTPADTLVVSASNAATNALLVFNADGALLRSIPTQGQGGVAGNAGGIDARHGRVAVVNFGSSNVSIFARDDAAHLFSLQQVIPTHGNPVSVALSDDHLYVLTTTQVESHAIGPAGVAPGADGVTQLLHADGSAAQVGVIKGQLVITEKSNAVETVNLTPAGTVWGAATMVANLPANIDTPLGLAARGDEAYVTIAHADETGLVRNAAMLTVTGSGTQHAPCWLALDGPFLFSSNSPSHSVSRYAVYGQHIVQDAAVAATFAGAPTDIAYRAGIAAVVDSNGTQSHVSVFSVDEDGNFALRGTATLPSRATNGIAIVPHG